MYRELCLVSVTHWTKYFVFMDLAVDGWMVGKQKEYILRKVRLISVVFEGWPRIVRTWKAEISCVDKEMTREIILNIENYNKYGSLLVKFLQQTFHS